MGGVGPSFGGRIKQPASTGGYNDTVDRRSGAPADSEKRWPLVNAKKLKGGLVILHGLAYSIHTSLFCFLTCTALHYDRTAATLSQQTSYFDLSHILRLLYRDTVRTCCTMCESANMLTGDPVRLHSTHYTQRRKAVHRCDVHVAGSLSSMRRRGDVASDAA